MIISISSTINAVNKCYILCIHHLHKPNHFL